MARITVAGILVHGNRFLVEKRFAGDTDPGTAIPGGHVEKGERVMDALKRELMEELSIEILRVEKIYVGNHTATDGERQRIHYFLVSAWKGSINSREAENVYWEADIGRLSTAVDRHAVVKALSTSR